METQTQTENRKQKAMCAMTGCKRKLRLVETTTLCKCSKAFCVTHRHSECHNCDFDYQGKTQRDLGASLVKTIAAKIEQI